MNDTSESNISTPRRGYRLAAGVLLAGFVVAVGFVVGASLSDSDEPAELTAADNGSGIPPGYEPADPDWPEGPIIPEGLGDRPPGELSPDEFQGVIDGYEVTNKVPVGTDDGNVVGFMRYDEYYADGLKTPPYIEVWSYNNNDDLVGYNVEYVGFVPIDEFPAGVPVADVIAEKYGEQIQSATAHQQEIDNLVESTGGSWPE